METEYANKEDLDAKFWKHDYEVILSEFSAPIIVNADCEGDALDYAMDYARDKGYVGLFLDNDDIEDMTEAELGDHICGGNEGRYLSSLNVAITEIR